jgi:hypothetical protein
VLAGVAAVAGLGWCRGASSGGFVVVGLLALGVGLRSRRIPLFNLGAVTTTRYPIPGQSESVELLMQADSDGCQGRHISARPAKCSGLERASNLASVVGVSSLSPKAKGGR